MRFFIFVMILVVGLVITRCGTDSELDDEADVHPGLVSGSDAIERVQVKGTRRSTDGAENVQRAKTLALSILSASANALPADRDTFRTMSLALERVQFDIPPPGQDLRECVREKNVLAFVMTQSRNTIHLCARALHPSSLNKLAQVLVHETAHVVGVDDECQATRIEVAAMRAANHRLAFQNGYMRRCGIH